MGKSIEELRVELNNIDDQLKKLFLERMEIVKGVAEYKIENNLPVLDQKREDEMIERLSSDINEELKESYKEFLKRYVSLSKDLQKKIIEDNK